jgi:hypothetical protein
MLHNINRRQFLAAASAATGGLLIPVPYILSAVNKKSATDFPSTDHFWYRKSPDSPYIDSQRGKKAFSFSDDTIFLSKNNSHNWHYRSAFPGARDITFSHIFRNGNILFATKAKIYLSTDNLKSYREVFLKNQDGTNYLQHTPLNSDNPGWYFHTLSGVDSWMIDGKEMLVWGNYCNVLGGASPSNIYYSTDNGETIKIAYAFGQNPYFRDNGSPGGGSTGTLLGNPDNPVICRHIHSVAYNPLENAFYACTGDKDQPKGFECHWLRGTYEFSIDKWNWKVLITRNLNSRYKAGGLSFVDGKVYWISDANGPEPYDRGIFCCDPADIPNTDKHTLLFDPKYESGTMIIQDGVILATHISVASPFTLGIIISPDMGKTWAEYDLKEFGPRSPSRIHPKNSEGWFRMDLRTGWITRTDVLFLKPKQRK